MSANRECPLVPMGAVTGKPSREFIRETLKAFRETGVTQYLIYPRSGCELEYMSEEWFETCRAFFEEGKALGFTGFWLYDEFNWPSGQCGGKVMAEKPEYGAPYFAVSEVDGEYKCRRGYNPSSPNVLDPEAVRFFIRNTHDKYAERFGAEFGTLIKGIFTDEPSFQYIWDGTNGDGEKVRVPYYNGLSEDYRKRTGHELFDDIVYCLKNKCARFYENDLYRLLGERFRTVYFEPLRAWCDAHHILHTGHLMAESAVTSSIQASGTPLEVIDSLSMPGMDEIFTRQYLDDMEWVTLGTVEHGIRANGRGGLAELFALGPCDMPLARMKKMIRIVSMFGVDHYILAVTQLDVRGNTKKTAWFNPYNRVQPWFHALKLLGEDAEYSARIAQKPFTPEIQIRYPGIHASLNPLLAALTDAQRQWALIRDDESASADHVLYFEDEWLKLEGSQNAWQGVAEFIAWLNRESPQEVLAENPDGSRASDLFLRVYGDRALEVVNLSRDTAPRALMLRRNGQRVRFVLPFNGVHSFPAWTVALDRPNLKRADWKDGRYEFSSADGLPGISLALRNYGGRVSVKLDGELIAAEAVCTSLPQGFRELYTESEPLTLSAGTHVLELAGEATEYPYLPGAFLCGVFASEGNCLRAYAGDGTGLESYSGTLIQEGEADVPPDALLLTLETGGLVTEVHLDGESLGERAWEPFAWRVPEKFAGRRVKVRIVKRTSCGPMFGVETFQSSGWLQLYAPDNVDALSHRISELQWR